MAGIVILAQLQPPVVEAAAVTTGLTVPRVDLVAVALRLVTGVPPELIQLLRAGRASGRKVVQEATVAAVVQEVLGWWARLVAVTG